MIGQEVLAFSLAFPQPQRTEFALARDRGGYFDKLACFNNLVRLNRILPRLRKELEVLLNEKESIHYYKSFEDS